MSTGDRFGNFCRPLDPVKLPPAPPARHRPPSRNPHGVLPFTQIRPLAHRPALPIPTVPRPLDFGANLAITAAGATHLATFKPRETARRAEA